MLRFENGAAVIAANRSRWDPYAPWRTLIPESMVNPFARKLRGDAAEEIWIKTDFILFAAGVRPESGLYDTLAGGVRQLYCIGDARQPASAWEAITHANEVARFI